MPCEEEAKNFLRPANFISLIYVFFFIQRIVFSIEVDKFADPWHAPSFAFWAKKLYLLNTR
jgi:hypothetical protein